MEFTEGITSPDIFRLWAAISTIAGAVERRVWVVTAQRELFPNLFILLVAPPGVGKSMAIASTADFWSGVSVNGKGLIQAPDNATKAAMVDALEAADRKVITKNGVYESHPLLVAASEFGVFVPSHDLEFLNVLNTIYDCPKFYREQRRTTKIDLNITRPYLNIIAGTQPGFLATVLPEQAWSMGFTSRVIMIYTREVRPPDLFGARPDKSALFKSLVSDLNHLFGLMGQFHWEPAAKAELQRWVNSGCEPVPEYSKLEHYNSRRPAHTIKLSMIAALSRSGELFITHEDVSRARDWLLQAESMMPDIFKDMKQKSDEEILNGLYLFVLREYSRGQSTPVKSSMLYDYLKARCPSEKIPKIIDVADRAGMIDRLAGTDDWKPNPQYMIRGTP